MCTGPNASDCQQCVENAEFDGETCVCITDYGGNECEFYIGECHPICVGCDGPGDANCLACRENAEKNSDGICECKENYSGDQCQNYDGDCANACASCEGPNPEDCLL